MALIGYARVSTDGQDLEPQLRVLREAGCERIYSEVASSTLSRRVELDKALDYVRAGDAFVVAAVDRISRNMIEFLSLVAALRARGVEVRSLTQGFDSGTAEGRMVMHLYATFAELEREQISNRTKAGLAAARARGRHGGRPVVLTPDRLEAIAALVAKDTPVREIAATLKISARSVSRGIATLRANDASERRA